MPKLFYIIGASGAGKDSLIDYLRDHIPGDRPIAFAHRYITRPANMGNENHIALTQQEFQLRQRHGGFAMQWQSHGNCYGIGCEIEQWMSQGLDVVVNGSRGYLTEAMQRYPNIVPILISVKPEILRQRLEKRGRESMREICERLKQAARLEHEVNAIKPLTIENNGRLRDAGSQLLNSLLDTVQQKCA